MNAPLATRALRATAAISAAAVIGYGLWYAFDTMSKEPVRRVIFTGDSAKLVRADLDAFAESIRGLPASGDSLAAIRDAARRIPWVREATVRRRFPDAVEIAFEAHEPLARWSDEALVSVRGEVFNAEFAGKLPLLRGAPGAAGAMAREYPAIARALAPIANVNELRLSPRGLSRLTPSRNGHSRAATSSSETRSATGEEGCPSSETQAIGRSPASSRRSW